jgi:hypothetical protein
MVTICFENKDETAEGKSAADAAKALFDAGADIVGMNCLRPPQHILGPMEQMRKAVSGYLACQPVAYRTPNDKPDFTSLPEFPYALDPLQLTRKEMADYAVQARDVGINYIGACCGTVAMHIREMARVLNKLEKGRGEADVGLRVLRPRQSGNGARQIGTSKTNHGLCLKQSPHRRTTITYPAFRTCGSSACTSGASTRCSLRNHTCNSFARSTSLTTRSFVPASPSLVERSANSRQ